MKICEKCGKETSLLNSLCDDCKKGQIKEEINLVINEIVKSITKEEPLMYMFFLKDVEKKENYNMLRKMAGGAIMGATGLLIGDLFSDKEVLYEGKLGILVVTKENIIIKYFNSDIYSPGCIYYEQLKQFLSVISTKRSLKHVNFEIRASEINNDTITSGSSTFSFNHFWVNSPPLEALYNKFVRSTKRMIIEYSHSRGSSDTPSACGGVVH